MKNYIQTKNQLIHKMASQMHVYDCADSTVLAELCVKSKKIPGIQNINYTNLFENDNLVNLITKDEIKIESKVELDQSLMGDIVFDKVCFAYEKRNPVFIDFDLTIEKGKITVLLGENGSGKTSLLSLIQKIHVIDEGNLKIGNYDINQISLGNLRTCINTVTEHSHFFKGNIIENITIGDFEPDLEKVFSICKDLNILRFIEELPDNHNTEIESNTVLLSAEQKQVLAIARALYREPEILLLDRATLFLNEESEFYVNQTLHNYAEKGKTVILVPTKLSTASEADKIILLEKGRIIEEGDHDSLFGQKGKYYQKLIQDFLP